MKYVSFNTYFRDELADNTPVSKILKMYGWGKTITCPFCGREVDTTAARFNPDYDAAACAECAGEIDPECR